MKLIVYKLSGEIDYEGEFIINRTPLGQKVRVTTSDGEVYIGFWNTPALHGELPDVIEVLQYDLDESTAKLRSYNDTIDSVPLDKIVKIEAILYSNPRWGVRPTNKFVGGDGRPL